jgi:ADP-heptose:LPS heptosyltransferase
MFRNPNEVKNVTTINCLLADGGLGDLICAFVPIDYLLKNCPWLNVLIWCPDYMVDFAKNILPKGAIVRGYTDAKKKYDNTKAGVTTKWVGNHTPMRTHAVDYSFHVLCDYHPKPHERNYLKVTPIDVSKFNLPKEYVVLQSAATEKVKAMPGPTFNAIKEYILNKGISVVLLGKTENNTGVKGITNNASVLTGVDDIHGAINLTNKTNLLESASIIAGAKCFVGMDGGLTHLAGFTDVPIIAGYTFADPSHLMPIRNDILGYNVYPVLPDASLACKFCQTKRVMYYDHDFRECFYKDYACVQQMTPEKFINMLKREGL